MATRGRARQSGTWQTSAEAGAASRAYARAGAADATAFPLVVFAVHWLLVQIPASLAFLWGVPNKPSPPYGRMPEPLSGVAHAVVEPLRQWDGLWYKLIAEQGYVGGTESAKAAFWPFFPWVMGAGGELFRVPAEVVGYVVGNAAFAAALLLLYRLIRLDFDDGVARRTLWAIALFPTALFFTAVYTESLFLALAVGALLAARTRSWWLAGLLGAVAALTRSYGVLLVLPFLVLLLGQFRFDLRRLIPAAIPAALPVLGPVLFGWHLQQVQGNWRAFMDVQTQWNRYSAMPWETLRCGIVSCFNIAGNPDGATWDWLRALVTNPSWGLLGSNAWRADVANSDTLELVCTLLFLALAVLGLRLLPVWQSAYLWPGLVIPLFQPSSVHALMSMPRFGLTLFPLFVVLAILLKPPRLAIPLAIVSSLLLVLLSVQFALWYWVS